jgi:hypothetical protein
MKASELREKSAQELNEELLKLRKEPVVSWVNIICCTNRVETLRGSRR